MYALYGNPVQANFNAISVNVPVATKTYYFKIRSYRGNYYSEFSNEIVTTGTSGSFNLTTQDYGTNYVTLRWNDLFTNEVGFSIERKLSYQDDSAWTEVGLAPASAGTIVYYYDNLGIQAGTSYNYRIRAIFNQGYSGYSNILAVTAKVL
jgi:hypothetical protein